MGLMAAVAMLLITSFMVFQKPLLRLLLIQAAVRKQVKLHVMAQLMVFVIPTIFMCIIKISQLTIQFTSLIMRQVYANKRLPL